MTYLNNIYKLETILLLLFFSVNVMATSEKDDDIKLAITIDSAIYHGNGDIVDKYIDYDTFTQRVFQKLHKQPSEWKEYASAFKQNIRLGDLLIEQIGSEGEYSFVKVIENPDGQTNLLYRMLKGDGWLDYHEVLLVKNHSGEWNVADVYFYFSGTYFSDIIATLLAQEDQELVANQSLRKSLLLTRELFGYNQEGMYGNTITAYDSLSNYFKKQKNTRLALLMALAGQGDMTQLENLKAKYLSDFPYDKSIRLMMMEVYGSLDNYEQSKVMNDELSELIGGDDYLKLRTAEIYLSWDKSSKAKKLLKKMIKAESFPTDARLLLMDVYYVEENYKGLYTELMTVSDMVGVSPEEILPKEHYPNFYASSSWQNRKKQQ
ncbi:hypothetical protein KMW28_18975 [Flammeovirga yaeyamensis]|uniref:Uncharacterized protein n=1 Tax=Flammeovirga yaeyamensis TaxID=367791 RepID=A0AAX1N642_9BACT|nr:hypothetical protein [Flammeovirga yaeyamensis]MBB3700702.1 hypothetical protein [Flammeovirga yaeyamensis]NMF37939.1 hypothetical protein [Flammeovirga yaeyamensis]QWG01700.1 hypothetical protein KMW28_18975 [Flammeovirga yaeyamensis]